MRLSVGLALCCLCTVVFAADPAHAAIRKDTSIPAEGLGTALQTLANTYDFQVLYKTELVQGLRTQGAAGSLTSEEALTKVLGGTGLAYKYLDANTVTVYSSSAGAAATGSQQNQTTRDNSQEDSGKKSSQDFRVAQVDQAPAGPQVTGTDHSVEKKPVPLEEVVVTGSRLSLPKTSAVPVDVYTTQDIADSGRTSIPDFLNTLPSVSLATTDNGLGATNTYGQTSVQLHGLPVGTTLVLLDGRRLESGGLSSAPGQANAFDLSSIPLGAIDRVEVVPEGSSAVYGSDAIAGVVNVILKKNLDGISVDAKFGGAAGGTRETDLNLFGGKSFERGGFTLAATYQHTTPLLGDQRAVISDFVPPLFSDYRESLCSAGNVFSLDGTPLPGAPNGETFAAVSPTASGNPRQTGFQGTYGKLNKCPILGGYQVIPREQRFGALGSAHYSISDSVEAFAELVYSHSEVDSEQGPAYMYGDPSPYIVFTVPADNPYNPFGTAVGVTGALPGLPDLAVNTSSDFIYVVGGLKGEISSRFQWEVSSWLSKDRANTYLNAGMNSGTAQVALAAALDSTDPATALNPFVAGPKSSPSVLNQLAQAALQSDNHFSGQVVGINATVRGDVIDLPAGPLKVAAGLETVRDSLSSSYSGYFVDQQGDAAADFSRRAYSAFAEFRAPLIGPPGPSKADMLAITLAGREDKYESSGSRFTPQYGLEFRPVTPLLFRASYAEAFKAPSLVELYTPAHPYNAFIVDPVLGTSYSVPNSIEGGNPDLKPETATSTTFGAYYGGAEVSGLHASVSFWKIDEKNSIQQIDPQTVVDNASLFPGAVTRDSSGQITQINSVFTNFGTISVRGLDYHVGYHFDTSVGSFSPSLTATQTTNYSVSLAPGVPTINALGAANDQENWSPKWKGTAALTWDSQNFRANIAGRYVDHYQDYDSTSEIGSQFFVDVSFRVDARRLLPMRGLANAYITVGAVNLFNRLPAFSNYSYGYYGYDPYQSDIRGRFLYAQVGMGL